MAISNGSALEAAASPGSILSIGSVGSLACVLSAGSLASMGSVLSGFSSWSLRAWRGQARQRQGAQLAGPQPDSALRPAGTPTGNGAGAPLQ